MLCIFGAIFAGAARLPHKSARVARDRAADVASSALTIRQRGVAVCADLAQRRPVHQFKTTVPITGPRVRVR